MQPTQAFGEIIRKISPARQQGLLTNPCHSTLVHLLEKRLELDDRRFPLENYKPGLCSPKDNEPSP